MKRNLATTALALWLGIIGAGIAHAQVIHSTAFTTVVPFEFAVGNRTLPAGTYTFEMVLGTPTEADQIGILVVRNLDGEHYVAQVTDVAQLIQASDKATAIFHRRGGRVVLSEVREAGKSVGLQLRPNPAENSSVEDSEEHEVITLLAVSMAPRPLAAASVYQAR